MWSPGTVEQSVVTPTNRNYIEHLVEQGYDVVRTPGNHLSVSPNKSRGEWLQDVGFDVNTMPSQVIFPSSPSDSRGLMNSLTDARKIGVGYRPPMWQNGKIPLAERAEHLLSCFTDSGITPSEAAEYLGVVESEARKVLKTVGVSNGRRRPLGKRQAQAVFYLRTAEDAPVETPESPSEAVSSLPEVSVREGSSEDAEAAPMPAVQESGLINADGDVAASTTSETETPEQVWTRPVSETKIPETPSSEEDLKELINMIMALPLSVLETTKGRQQLRRLAPLYHASQH